MSLYPPLNTHRSTGTGILKVRSGESAIHRFTRLLLLLEMLLLVNPLFVLFGTDIISWGTSSFLVLLLGQTSINFTRIIIIESRNLFPSDDDDPVHE